jgi:hypothetical protein
MVSSLPDRASANTSSTPDFSTSIDRIENQYQEDPNSDNTSVNPAEAIESEPNSPSSADIVPARGMYINDKGQVVLTGYPTPNATPRPANHLFDCNDLKNSLQGTGDR